MEVYISIFYAMLTSTVADQLLEGKLDNISIVIPIYNQQHQISKALDRIMLVLDEAFINYEVVAVDDGSTDGTYEVLEKERQSRSKLKVISYKPNRGKGFAVKTGVLESKGSVVLFTDGDLDISPSKIKEYVDQLAICDLVIASKRHPMSRINVPLSRRFLSKIFNIFVRLATGIKVKDTQVGMKVGDGPLMRAIFNVILVKRYAFDVEVLTIASVLGLRIREMPVEIDIDRKFRVKEIFRMFIDVLSIAYRLKIIKWYEKRAKSLDSETQTPLSKQAA